MRLPIVILGAIALLVAVYVAFMPGREPAYQPPEILLSTEGRWTMFTSQGSMVGSLTLKKNAVAVEVPGKPSCEAPAKIVRDGQVVIVQWRSPSTLLADSFTVTADKGWILSTGKTQYGLEPITNP
ncbi:MAG TPA: hypothetical protein DCS97_03295 [Planctomycetes bacterium]|nr:hypothetical protein [Planctomycetota bacterium]